MRQPYILFPLLVLVLGIACGVTGKLHPQVEPRPDQTGRSELEPLPALWGGANQPQLWFQPAHRRERQLAAMRDAGLRVLRIILGHRAEPRWWEDPPDPYTFEDPIGFFHEEEFRMVDQLIADCRRFKIRLIITLGVPPNYFAEFGDWNFYVSPVARHAYLNRIRQCVQRIHADWGVMWKDIDDVIWAWEIANEPGGNLRNNNSHSPEETTLVLSSWLTLCARTISDIDPDTLVSIGTGGYSPYYNLNCGDDLRTLGDIPEADIYTLHFYGGDLRQWIRDAKTVTEPYGKLLLVEEFGNRRKAGQEDLIKTYRYVTEICRAEQVPWMFWRMGHRKDEEAWCIMSGDPVWREVVVPAGQGREGPPTADR